MLRSKKFWISFSILMVIIIVIVIIIKYKKAKAQQSLAAATSNTPVSAAAKTNKSGFNSAAFPLKVGSKGPEVKVLQQALNDNNTSILPNLNVDGVFGPLTLGLLQKELNYPLDKIYESQLVDIQNLLNPNKKTDVLADMGIFTIKTF
jgi:ABC-type Na+ efflux pump permease subunit